MAINGALHLKAILPSLFLCVYIAIFATILAVMLWQMDHAAALQCNDYRLEFLLAGTIKGSDFDQISTFFYVFNLLFTPAPFLDFWLEHSRSHLFY